MSLTKCSKCQSKAVRSYARPGRIIRYRNVAAMPIPDSFPIPTCSRCHAEFFDARTSEALAPLLHEQYLEQLRQRAKSAIDILMLHISQRRLELLIGLSQGYLSRLRIGAGNPSAELVSHLAMLAHDPKTRLAELERYWAIGL